MENEIFYANVVKQGKRLTITLPNNLCKYADIQQGDHLKIFLKKATYKEQETDKKR
jgi:antitoxin component of MazEF toxin-antitoxin module